MKKCYLLGFMIWILCSSLGQNGVDLNFCEGRGDGFYVNPLDCSTFYQCRGERTYFMRCMTGLVFDEKCKCCNWPENQLCITSKAHAMVFVCDCDDGMMGSFYECNILVGSTLDCVRNSPCYRNLNSPNSVCSFKIIE